MLTLFLGAGFSKWAFDLPLVSNLFDFDVSVTSEQEDRKLQLIEKDWNEWEKANPGITAEKFVHWCIEKSSHRKSRIIWYVSRRLTEPFMTKISGAYSAAMFDERVVRENKSILKLNQFFKKLQKSGLQSIITCNYDTIVECALGTSGFHYGYVGEQLIGRGINPQFPWMGAHLRVTGSTPLIKLHGSLSWDKKAKYTSGKPGRAGKAFIVPPAPEKIPPPELKDVWELGSKLLEHSTCLIVFGFAFNPYDEALLDYLKNHGSNVTKVLLIDPFPNIESAKKLWPNCQIDTIDPRKKFNINKWLVSNRHLLDTVI
ncbi:SIR2 family protein [Aliivibrio kagoshimensis]|uniref:SIR2 family protein n=1 Tax=Aliivibrio kagoshimensis TaxID=2910230 RepID=UPI003D0AAD98